MPPIAITFAESALGDLEAIKDWYAEQKAPHVGKRLVAEIFERVEALAEPPDMGRIVPEFQQPFLREFIFPPFRIVYRHDRDRVRDTVNFHDPRMQTGIIRPPVTELTAYNTDQVVVQVVPGTLLLFPAWLPHSVDRNRSDRERISLSFNLMFSHYAERMAKLLWEGGIRRSGSG